MVDKQAEELLTEFPRLNVIFCQLFLKTGVKSQINESRGPNFSAIKLLTHVHAVGQGVMNVGGGANRRLDDVKASTLDGDTDHLAEVF